MTVYARTIENYLSYSATDFAVTNQDELKIIKVIRGDPNLDLTINELKKKRLLETLFSRVDSSNNRSILAQTIAAKLTSTSYPGISTILAKYPKVKVTFERCFDLHSSLKPYGVVPPAPKIPAASLISANATQPFTGSGATGISPTVHSIGVIDKGLLAIGSNNTVQEYSNPIPGDLGTYLSGLTPDERKSQAVVIYRRPIISVYPASYVGGLPTRSQVINAAGKMYKLHPALIAAFILAEQRDQSKKEDAKDYIAATSMMKGNTSIGLGQVVVSTAMTNDLFSGLLSPKVAKMLSRNDVALFLTSDEFNVFAVAKYIRLTANTASKIAPGTLVNTENDFPLINFKLYKDHSSKWPDDNIRALASEYTTRPWDDRLSTGWAFFVYEAYKDILKAGIFK
jgi:hypothetical protein